MSVAVPHRWLAPARSRAAAGVLGVGVPIAIVAVVAAARFGGIVAALVALVATAAIAIGVRGALRRHDTAWLVRGLDAARADMEDSADLLFAADTALSPLQRLQRDRLLERLAADAGPDLRPAPPVRAIGAAWIAAAIGVAASLLLPGDPAAVLAPAREGLAVTPGVARLAGQRLRVVPPPYTGLPARDLATLDARAPEGSRLVWTLAFDPAPAGAVLAFHDGARVALRPQGTTWRAGTTLARSTLYRVMPAGTDRLPPLHRLDAIPDRPPAVTTALPTLVLAGGGQRAWLPAFAATDDYGVVARATLRLTLAQGEGENVTFGERSLTVAGSGPPRARRFAVRIDLAAAGFTGVGDLIAQLSVSDARGHVVRGPSLILRRAAAATDAGTGLEGAVKKALPAYFRSQRQIIIDAEALLRERRRLDPDTFTKRSDAIGVDQRMLRMRYGQFLGEESEGPSLAVPTSDAEHADEGGDEGNDGHDHAATADAHGNDVLADYGHTHDEPEAATLLDPATRATLRQALDQMWQSEGRLRAGDPAGALPHANRALVFIKRVQQATRIFLQRTGSAQPAIDETRRMTGKRDGVAGGTLALAAPPPGGTEPAATWRALAGGGPVALGGVERWLRAAAVPDRLALAGAIDAVRREPSCATCRLRLRALLWAALPRPVPRVTRRNGADAAGRRYLDAIAR